MDVDEAWQETTGSNDIVVAVLDTGIDYTHSDLKDNMWNGNAHHGYDFAGDNDGDNDDDPMPDTPYDENGHYHGTHVAGIIGAVGNNAKGVVGVSQHVRLMALKVFRPNGYGYSSDILEALDFIDKKIDEGVNIVAINASYGGSGGENGDAIDEAIKKLGRKGVVFCAAAGNDGKNIDNDPIYPAAYDAKNIITVAASDQNDNLASFSNYGTQYVDVAAPGVNILSTYPENKYAYMQGTSMATPEVTGVVALLSSYDPSASVQEKIDAIIHGVDKKENLKGKVASGGRVNTKKAIELLEESQNHPPRAQDESVNLNEDESKEIILQANDEDGDSLSYTITKEPKHGKLSGEAPNLTYTPNQNYNGSDSFSFVVNDGISNSNEATISLTIKAVNDAPIAKDDKAQTNEDEKVVINVLQNDSDIDGDTLTIKSVTTPSHGSVKVVDKKIEYIPNSNFNGKDSFKYSIKDTQGATSSALVEVKVEAVNDAPIAKDDEAYVTSGKKVIIDVLDNDSDVDGDSLTIKSITNPSHGSAKIVDNQIEYYANKEYEGKDSFIYTIKDSNGATAKAKVDVYIKKSDEREFSFPLIGDNNVETIIKIIGSFRKNLEDGFEKFILPNNNGEIIVNPYNGNVQIKSSKAVLPKNVLSNGSIIKYLGNKIEIECKIKNEISF